MIRADFVAAATATAATAITTTTTIELATAAITVAVIIIIIIITDSHYCLDSKPLIPYFYSQFSNCVSFLTVLVLPVTLDLLVSPRAITTKRISHSAIGFCCEVLRRLMIVASIRSTLQPVAFPSRTRCYSVYVLELKTANSIACNSKMACPCISLATNTTHIASIPYPWSFRC